MATISREKRSGRYRVLIRRRGLPTVSKTFTLKRDAQNWARDIEGDREKHIAEGNTVARSMMLSELIDEYLSQWAGRDSSTLSRLAWWREEYGHKLIGEVDKVTIRKGMKTGGRKAGTPNKLTHEYRQLLAKALEGEIDALPETLANFQPQQRMDAIIKLMKYIVGPIEAVRSCDIDRVVLDPTTHKAGLHSAIETDKIIYSL